MDRWEYHVTLLYSDIDRASRFLAAKWPDMRPDKHAPESLIPALDELGAAGWELVSIQPVFAGTNSELAILGGPAGVQWSAWYLCSFKRRLPDDAAAGSGAA